MAADEETFIEKEQVEHEYIHEGDEARLETLEDVRNIHEEDEARLEALEDVRSLNLLSLSPFYQFEQWNLGQEFSRQHCQGSFCFISSDHPVTV